MKFSKSTFINLIVTTSLALTALVCSFVVYGWFSTSWSGSESKIDFKTGENTVPDGKYFIYLSQDDVDYDTTRYTILVNQYDELIANKQGQIELATEEMNDKTDTKTDKTSKYNTLVNTTIPKIEKVISSLEKSITSTTGEIDTLREDIDNTTAQIEALEEGDPEIDNLNEEIADLEDANEELRADVNSLTSEIEGLNSNLATLTSQRDQLQTQFNNLSSELSGYVSEKEEKETLLPELNSQLSTNEGLYEGYLVDKANLEKDIEDLTEEITELNEVIIPGYKAELAQLQTDRKTANDKKTEVQAKAANLWKEYDFYQGSLLESKVLLEEVDIVDTEGNTYEDTCTTFDYVLERIQLGTIDSLLSLKPDNHFFVRFYIEPSVHGKNMNVSTSYYDDNTILIDKNKNVVKNDPVLTEINTSKVDLLTFKVATSADPYTPGTTDFDSLEFAKFSETIVSETPYYLYLEITPDLTQFTDMIEQLNPFMDCVLLFKVNIELSSYTSPGTED